MEFNLDESAEEHKAWLDLFNEMCKVFDKTTEELNEKKYRRTFELIERWAYYDRLRRTGIIRDKGVDDFPFGVFWNGTEPIVDTKLGKNCRGN